jgi:hypothetical protein
MNKTNSSRVVGNRIGKLWVEKYLSPITIKPLLEQAKEMEKAQIIEGYAHGHDDGWGLANNKKQEFIHARQYYEQTYGGNKCQETK